MCSSKADGYRRSWRKTQHLADVFLDRWLKECLRLLQSRAKWYESLPNVKVGDLVLIKDENTKRGSWPKGVVESVVPGNDGLVRRARIRTAHCSVDRDICKVCLLEGVRDTLN